MNFIEIKTKLENIKTRIAVAEARKIDLSKKFVEMFGTSNVEELNKILETYRSQLVDLRDKSSKMQQEISNKLTELEKQVN